MHVRTDRNNNLNFLRLLFALLVLLSHSPELVDGNRSREILTQTFHTISFGEFAVDGFFLLSGYLIVQSWHLAPDIWRFLQKRVLRIYPGFIAATFVCAFIVGPLAADLSTYFATFEIGGFFKGVVTLKLPVTPPVFQGQPYAHVNGAMWTIRYEFICYLLVLALGMVGTIQKRRMWLIITSAIFAVLLADKLGYVTSNAALQRLSRLSSFFFAGGCFYLYRDVIRLNGKAAIVAAFLLMVGMFSLRAAEFACATVGAYLLFYLAFRPIPVIDNFNKLPDVSYGVYLYGWPVQKLLYWYFPTMSPWLHFLLSCVASVLLGAISWYAIEKPFLSLKTATWSRILSRRSA